MNASNQILLNHDRDVMKRTADGFYASSLKASMKERKRETWASNFESFLTVLGGIIGLGNIWRFPYITYTYGGGAFLIPYMMFVLLCGFPMLFTETALGQHRRGGAIKVWDIAPIMRGIGFGSTMLAVYSSIYYIMVMAWAIFYFVHSLTTETLPWMSCDNSWNTANCSTYDAFTDRQGQNVSLVFFNATRNGSVLPTVEFWDYNVLRKSSGLHEIGTLANWKMLLCFAAAWIMIYFCVFKGVKSVGKVVYVTAIFPYIILLILLVQTCTLEGATEGIIYYLRPNATKLLDPNVWVQAGSQVCFSFAICFAILISLGSFNDYNMNCYRYSIILSASCSFTSFVSGFAVFGLLGHMAFVTKGDISDVVNSGPGLAFITYPLGLSLLKLPQLWNALFFLMIIVIAIDSQFCTLEGFITVVCDHWERANRHKEVFSAFICFAFFLIGLVFITNGGIYVFEIFNNYAVSGIALLWLVLMQSITVGWIYGTSNFYEDIHDMIGYYPSMYLKLAIKIATPLLTLVVMVYYFAKYTPVKLGHYVYPTWGTAIGWFLCMSSFLCVPIFAVYYLLKEKGTLKERVVTGFKSL